MIKSRLKRFDRDLPFDLPFDLSFDDNYKHVIRAIGEPSIRGGGKKSIFGGVITYWLRYDFKDYSVNIRFCKKKKTIVLVALMSSDTVPKPL